jgi:hypothetical protein
MMWRCECFVRGTPLAFCWERAIDFRRHGAHEGQEAKAPKAVEGGGRGEGEEGEREREKERKRGGERGRGGTSLVTCRNVRGVQVNEKESEACVCVCWESR